MSEAQVGAATLLDGPDACPGEAGGTGTGADELAAPRRGPAGRSSLVASTMRWASAGTATAWTSSGVTWSRPTRRARRSRHAHHRQRGPGRQRLAGAGPAAHGVDHVEGVGHDHRMQEHLVEPEAERPPGLEGGHRGEPVERPLSARPRPAPAARRRVPGSPSDSDSANRSR